MQTRTIEHASAMPAPTWHRLNMNDATIEIADLQPAQATQLQASGAQLTQNEAFADAMAAAQKAWAAQHAGSEYLRNYTDEQAERLGGTALSRYQENVDEVESLRDITATFEHGMGQEATSYLREMAGNVQVVEVAEGATAQAALRIDGIDASANVAAVDIVAAPGSNLEAVITVDSPAKGSGLTGSTLRIFAGHDAHVTVKRVQTLDDSWTDLDDMGLFLDDGATVEICQTVLGAGKSYTGLAGDLRGEGSHADISTHYLGHGAQELDFSYTLRHHGKKTTCDIYANGVLAGTSTKTLRGTIDLLRGGKGAEGKETETVLLVDEGVHNKTVPTILCNEDDVMGNHGATIGHIRAEQMFYLASRGLSQAQAEAMFVSANLEQAAIEAPDAATRTAVVRLGSQLVEGFEELIGTKDEEDAQ